jgi:hypothetical protein
MEPSVEKAIEAIDPTPEGVGDSHLRGILLQFYKDRTIELLTHIDEQNLPGLCLVDEHIKIGGTD